MTQTQNFENHTKFVPAFHIGVLGIFTLNLGWSLYRVAHAFSAEAVMSLLLAIAFILLAFYGRIFALRVQDRVIRLEMRMRMLQILPADLQPRIPEFTLNQLVALRFASDAELPGLAGKVLDGKLDDRKAIKKMIQNWQPDFLRA
jgi:dolichyl-phosphate-mannose--protein O-mannosyl transferase